MLVLYIFIFILGLILGSFVNALQYRHQKSMSITGRSFCPHCKHVLVWNDLFPVFSWVFLKGRCRYCKKTISIQYPIIEILSGFSLVILAKTMLPANSLLLATSLSDKVLGGWLAWLVLLAALSTILVFLGLNDFKTGYVISSYTYIATIISLIIVSINPLGFIGYQALLTHLYAGIGAALPFLLLWAISKGKWMGAGDIELAFMVGVLLGWPKTLVGVYFAFVLGSLVGVFLVLKKKSQMKSQISFGPFLISGIYFSLLFGQQIAAYYVKIFLG